MRQYKEVTVQKTVISRIVCNCCGRTVGGCGDGGREEFLTIAKRWGYFSPFDGEKHVADICPSCYRKWIQTFAIPPVTQE